MSKSSAQLAKEETKKPKRWQPTAVYRCSLCQLERRIRADIVPTELQCAHCDRRIRPKVIREKK